MLFNDKKAKILFFGTHPDDIEIGCGGTALLLSKLGCQIHHGILTSGEEGGVDITKSDLIKIREEEARKAADLLGAKSIHFFRYPDGLTHFTKDMKIEVMKLLKHVNPDIVFVHCSDDQNPDHQVCTKLVLDAINGCSGPWYPETDTIQIHPKLILGYEVWTPIKNPQTSVDISKVLDKKLEAIRVFKSQTKDIHYDKAIEGLAYYRSLVNKNNLPAEAFQIFSADLT
jgi:LmbE family N-acetylglucosaminyl deacetylase